MLTARSVILAIVGVAVLSLLSAVVSVFLVGDAQSELGRDFYGTRTNGFRAVHDVIEALDYRTERSLIPSAPSDPQQTSYVLWSPQERLVQTEPAYFAALADWVRDGGRLVVSPGTKESLFDQDICYQCSQPNCKKCVPVDLFAELGLPGVKVDEFVPEEYAAQKSAEEKANENLNRSDAEEFREAFREVFRIKQRPTTFYAIDFEGDWSHLQAIVERVQLPFDKSWSLEHEEEEAAKSAGEAIQPVAKITVADAGRDEPVTLAASYAVGEGEVVVISNPYLATNANLGGADNSVLVTHLLTGSRPRIVFDGFYHGLTVRGNAFWLLSKGPYAMTAVAILVVVGLWIWRQAIFLGPSRADQPVTRRSLREYVEAMSRFLLKGRGSEKYVLSEVRDGVLWHFCKTLGLPPRQQNPEIVLGLLARRKAEQATQLEAALKFADATLADPRASQDRILQATRKVSDCLSI